MHPKETLTRPKGPHRHRSHPHSDLGGPAHSRCLERHREEQIQQDVALPDKRAEGGAWTGREEGGKRVICILSVYLHDQWWDILHYFAV